MYFTEIKFVYNPNFIHCIIIVEKIKVYKYFI